MICIEECAVCIHQRHDLKDGWIPTCDAFPDGKPKNFNYGRVTEMKECNNGIGYEKDPSKPDILPK
ncbi:glutamyl-tRNA amidotransferase [Treponema pectinovorum]|uniref:glutamyl-tRNA amidotransferase n=1 Tax=Treponema pectinovorum TaxID=164 RepID=UPI0011C790C6|nr:glutamyl-tRNA amidotransferase [Treponema pectinovorum]